MGLDKDVFLGSFPAISRDLGFLSIQFEIQIHFLPDRLGRAGSWISRPPFTPHVIVSFLPKPLTWKKSRMEDGEENSHLFILEMDWSNPFSWRGNPILPPARRLGGQKGEGKGKRGVTKVVPCETWKWSLGKTGIGTLNLLLPPLSRIKPPQKVPSFGLDMVKWARSPASLWTLKRNKSALYYSNSCCSVLF